MIRSIIRINLLSIFAILAAVGCRTIEEPSYTVELEDGAFQIRDYEAYIVAEVVVDASLEEAGNEAFRKLFGYISGNNTAKAKIDMTAPVNQEKASEKISMTAPVNQEKAPGKGYAVSFTMPASKTMDNLPMPNDKSITLREVDGGRVAAIKYSGSWSGQRYTNNLNKLEVWIKNKSLTTRGPAVWARYNAPFTLPILRRNEILIPIEENNWTGSTGR